MIIAILSSTIYVLSLLVLLRALLSWFPNVDYRNPVVEFLVAVTEPILAPIRAILPRFGPFDLTPMIAIFVLIAISRALASA
jgi:YggT family protein